MAPRIVSRVTYYFWTTLFYSLCLCGFIWQAWQISENFFKFEVVKDINVFTPEESPNKDKAAYVCFYNYLVCDETARTLMTQRYGTIFNYLPLKERFEIIYESNETFLNTYSSKIIDELMRYPYYCYKFTLSALDMNRKMLQGNVYDFFVAIGHKESPFDQKRLVKLEIKWRKASQRFQFKSHSFNVTKLRSPYTDHCYDYTSHGFIDRNDAIADCSSNDTHLSWRKVISKSEYNLSNATLQYDDECDESKFEVDCGMNLYLTQIVDIIANSSDDPYILFINDTEASFSVISKAKIDDIDYVTYILGALGTWLGFSFIGINPIPYFMREQENSTADINQQTNQSNVKRGLIRMNQESNQKFTSMGQKLHKCTQTINELKQDNDEIKQSIVELKQSIVELKHNMRR